MSNSIGEPTDAESVTAHDYATGPVCTVCKDLPAVKGSETCRSENCRKEYAAQIADTIPCPPPVHA